MEACDEGWEKHGDHCYYWVAEKMNWTRAEDFCQKEEGHLASVSSNETMDFVTAGSASRGLKNVWLGGNDIEEEGVWKWTALLGSSRSGHLESQATIMEMKTACT